MGHGFWKNSLSKEAMMKFPDWIPRFRNPQTYLDKQIHRVLDENNKITIPEPRPKTESSDKAPVLEPRSNVSLETEKRLRRSGGYTVKFRKGVKLITCFRFLLAKALFSEEGLHLDEYLALMEAFLRLREARDPSFVEKYGQWLITIEPVLQQLGQVRVFPLKPYGSTTELERLLVPFLPSRSAYHGYEGHRELRDSFRVLFRNPLAPIPKSPPKRYIGVGYKDKGARRDPAWDGSPRWQDVASQTGFTDKVQLEQEEQRESLITGSNIRDLFTPPNGSEFD
jgi:hypothetical protein